MLLQVSAEFNTPEAHLRIFYQGELMRNDDNLSTNEVKDGMVFNFIETMKDANFVEFNERDSGRLITLYFLTRENGEYPGTYLLHT